MFTVYPGFGSVSPGGQQIITVDCVADPVGKCEEFLAIDISDRDPREYPAGIPYTLLAEACLPGTATQPGPHPERPTFVTPLPLWANSSKGCLGNKAGCMLQTLELPLRS